VRWVVDTSAWARRDNPAVRQQLNALLDEGGELVLSPAVLLELLRGPQGQQVAEERESLTAAMTTLAADAQTFEIAAGAMERLALHAPEAHRLSVADLVTAALAHQHECGVAHVDGDYEQIAEHAGLTYKHRRLALNAEGGEQHPMAGRQRALKKELAQLLHQLSTRDAEALLERVVQEAREAAASA
jgi:predicted nucleic acid-binding protein